MSIVLPWSEFKSYEARFGPGRERPPRPDGCVFCAFERVWFDGWRKIAVTVLADDGTPCRAAEGVYLQRARCARRECGHSWTIRPPWAYVHRSIEPDVAEAAAFAYLADPDMTYRRVAALFHCAWVTVWLWVTWVSALATPAALLSRVARVDRRAAMPEVMRHQVAAAARARTQRRARLLLRAYQVLTALALLHRAQPEPPSDPSPLRWFLQGEFLAFRRKAPVTRRGFSPAFDISRGARPR
jgi:hypothetical protein